jgi:uncharacterized protein YjbJ (UPF0337 family)
LFRTKRTTALRIGATERCSGRGQGGGPVQLIKELESGKAASVGALSRLNHVATVEGNWKQVKGKVKEQWGKLTDDDLDVIAGKQDQLEGRLQQRYGYAKDQAKKEVNDWYDRQTWQ